MKILAILDDFLSLVYPAKCIGCNVILGGKEAYLCLHCETTLGLDYVNITAQESLKSRLYGRTHLTESFVAHKFFKGGIVQRMVYEVKYKGHKNAAIWLGHRFGNLLADYNWGNPEPIFIPVPLHQSKMYKRGFNQSEFFARGLSLAMGFYVDTTSLVRIEKRSSQTNKGRFQRWLNAEYLYFVKDDKSVKDKHVILVDDVLTTGATIESCANILFEAGAAKVSLIALAVAVKIGQ